MLMAHESFPVTGERETGSAGLTIGVIVTRVVSSIKKSEARETDLDIFDMGWEYGLRERPSSL
jgi:hypothetical protein